MSDRKGHYVAEKDDATEASARNQRIDVYQNIGKKTLVTGSVTSKRGKSAGFYCPSCDLTFRDSISYTDHLNSKQHLHTAGLKEHKTRASLEDVKNRLEILRNKKLKQNVKENYDIKKRLEARKELEEKVKDKKRLKRQKKKEKRNAAINR